MSGYFNIDKMKEQLNSIKEKIQYNRELGVTEKNYDSIPSKPTIKLGEKQTPITKPSKKMKGGLKMMNLLQ